MKVVMYTRDFDTWHPEAGILKKGPIELPDELADRLLVAGAITGDFAPPVVGSTFDPAVAAGLVPAQGIEIPFTESQDKPAAHGRKKSEG